MYSIGDLSQQTDVSTKAIRYYEQIALLPKAQRAANGYRQYDDTDVERLRFIRRSRALDFAIDEIKEILDFRERDEPPCQYVMTVMQQRMTEIEQRIRDLENLRDEIARLHHAGQQLPEDVQMRECVCHLIKIGNSEDATASRSSNVSQFETTLELLQRRRSTDIPPEAAKFQLALTRLLAKGRPVSARHLAEQLNDPIEFVNSAFEQMRQRGSEFDENGNLIGAALTLTPTRHQFMVDGRVMYAWCALDTLFLPAYIGATAQVSSTCPVTDTPISLTISPHEVTSYTPADTVLSIMTAEHCTAGLEGSFCGQVHFFASRTAAQQWVNDRPDFAIVSVDEAYLLAQKLYIEPIMKHND